MSPQHSPGPISLRAWAWLVLAATVVLCGAVAAFNLVVDPTAQLGTGVLDPVAAGPRDRTAKVELLDGQLPPLVVLGSSRTKKLDPAWLEPDHDGINAAVVGGDLFEARVLTAWLMERAAQADGRPILVVGVDVEQFRDSSLQGSGFLDVPQLADLARSEAAGSDGSLGDELDRLEGLLLTWQVTKASVASVRARTRGGGSTGDAVDAGREESGFSRTGVPTADARWFDPAQAERFARATPGRIERNIAELEATYATNGATLDPDAVADLRALVRSVHETGGPGYPLVLYVTPAHPTLVDELGPRGRDERARRVLALLQDIGNAIVLDCTACIGPAATNWIDATHPSPIGARQLADRLNDVLPGPVPADPRSGAERDADRAVG